MFEVWIPLPLSLVEAVGLEVGLAGTTSSSSDCSLPVYSSTNSSLSLEPRVFDSVSSNSVATMDFSLFPNSGDKEFGSFSKSSSCSSLEFSYGLSAIIETCIRAGVVIFASDFFGLLTRVLSTVSSFTTRIFLLFDGEAVSL